MSDSGHHVLGAAPVPGSRVGPYTIDASIGSGGVASVFKAHDAAGKVVALKILHPSRVIDEDVKRFTREYNALSRLDHPNVVRVYEAGVENGYPWLAIEYVDGSDLSTLIDRWEVQRPADRFASIERILRDLCTGLQYIHERGLVHRDLKPTNILVTKSGAAKLTDFGVVKDSHSNATALTVAGRLVGTVAFMAPEQITGDRVDARADLYALGAVLYVMLTFKRPIEASSVAGYLARHLTEVPRPPGEVDPTVPQKLERICQRLLLKDPAQRHASAQAVLEALDRPEQAGRMPLRGRERGIEEWTKRVGTLIQGGGGTLAIIGARRAGRSHLLSALVEVAQGQGANTVLVDGSGRDLVSTMLETVDDSTSPGARGAIEPADRLAAGLHGQPWLLAVDDLDRAGALDITRLGRIMRQRVTNEGERVLLAFTTTAIDGPLAALTDGGSTGLVAETLSVGPIDKRAVLAILRDRGVSGALLPVLGRRLHEDYEGRAGLMIEQIEALVEARWLDPTGDLLRPTKPVDVYRKGQLPVPARVASQLAEDLGKLEEDGRNVVDTLAVLDRPAPSSLIHACVGPDVSGPESPGLGRLLDRLCANELLKRRAEEEQEVFLFAHPAAWAFVRERVAPDRKRQLHAAIASALSRRRRREASLELAHHLLESGDTRSAYPLLVQAARAAARNQRFPEVFEIAERVRAIRDACEKDLDPKEAARLRRWMFLLEGEARLAKAEWQAAVSPLEGSVAAARIEGDPAGLSRCLGSLGRAWYRQAQFDRARPLLEEALACADPGAPERASATRALADILLRGGDIVASEKLWEQALQLAEAAQSRDGEARARRGLAHVRVLQGRLEEASRLLDVAEDMLNNGGDARVRAAVMARTIELDIVAGRFANALRRCEVLLDLLREKEMPERMAEAWALCAEARMAVGETEAAVEAVRQTLAFAKASPDGDARIRSARILGALGQTREALAALPRPEELPTNPVDDPAAQLAALRARLIATDQPDTARDLATWVAVRPPALLGLRAAQIAIDAASALAAVGDVELARTTAKKGLKALQPATTASRPGPPPTEGLVLELLLVMQRAAPDERVGAAARQVTERIAEGLPGPFAASFLKRKDLA